MAKDTTPQELFKAALAVTTKAMSAEREIEVGFGNDAGDQGDRIVLRQPPIEISAELAARIRGSAATRNQPNSRSTRERHPRRKT